jgi:tRNA(Ile)-lysidine synthase
VVAYSGGADSLSLLHALVRARSASGQELRAVHVDHGLHADSASWAVLCGEVCERLGVPLTIERVRVGAGRGVEAAAREARYAALARLLGDGEILCTAHHADDQAETLLIALARGSGPAGLAGIAPWARFAAGFLARPLLAVPRHVLWAYARATRLPWVEDPSNADLARPRNDLRRRILPVLRAHWPGLGAGLVRAARLQADATELLEVLGHIDLESTAGPVEGTLSRSACSRLGDARVRNLLRLWLRDRGLPTPAARHLDRIVHDALASRRDAQPLVTWPGAEVRRHRDALYAMAPLASAPPRQLVVPWVDQGPLWLPHGRLTLERTSGAGLRACLAPPGLEVRFRRGGERCRPAGRVHGQTLKRLLNERGVPPWQRERLPLIYRDGTLVAVPGLWVCAGFEAGSREAGLRPVWQAR